MSHKDKYVLRRSPLQPEGSPLPAAQSLLSSRHCRECLSEEKPTTKKEVISTVRLQALGAVNFPIRPYGLFRDPEATLSKLKEVDVGRLWFQSLKNPSLINVNWDSMKGRFVRTMGKTKAGNAP